MTSPAGCGKTWSALQAQIAVPSGRGNGRAELLANRAALVMWSGVGCNLSAVNLLSCLLFGFPRSIAPAPPKRRGKEVEAPGGLAADNFKLFWTNKVRAFCLSLRKDRCRLERRL